MWEFLKCLEAVSQEAILCSNQKTLGLDSTQGKSFCYIIRISTLDSTAQLSVKVSSNANFTLNFWHFKNCKPYMLTFSPRLQCELLGATGWVSSKIHLSYTYTHTQSPTMPLECIILWQLGTIWSRRQQNEMPRSLYPNMDISRNGVLIFFF